MGLFGCCRQADWLIFTGSLLHFIYFFPFFGDGNFVYSKSFAIQKSYIEKQHHPNSTKAEKGTKKTIQGELKASAQKEKPTKISSEG